MRDEIAALRAKAKQARQEAQIAFVAARKAWWETRPPLEALAKARWHAQAWRKEAARLEAQIKELEKGKK